MHVLGLRKNEEFFEVNCLRVVELNHSDSNASKHAQLSFHRDNNSETRLDSHEGSSVRCCGGNANTKYEISFGIWRERRALQD